MHFQTFRFWIHARVLRQGSERRWTDTQIFKIQNFADYQGERPPTSRLSRLGALDKYLCGVGREAKPKGGFDVGKGEGPRHREVERPQTSRRGGSTFALVVGKILCRLGKVNFADNHKGRTSLNQVSGDSKGARTGPRPDHEG